MGRGAIVDEVAGRFAPDDPHSARGQALALFTMMVGTLQLFRAVADRWFADEVLEQGLANALALLGAAQDA